MAVIDVFSEDTMFYTDGKLKILSSFKITIVVGKYCKQQAKKKISTHKLKWVKSLSRVWVFATPWTAACQAPPSMGFSRQEYWSGLPFPSPGDLPNPGIEPRSPTLQADALTSEPPGKPYIMWKVMLKESEFPELFMPLKLKLWSKISPKAKAQGQMASQQNSIKHLEKN